MSLSPQTKHRLPTIKQMLLKGDNYMIIGEQLGVTERTIDRDVKAWLDSGDFEAWIKEQWIELHGKIVAEEPIEAYRQVSKLLAKMVTRKAEIREQVDITTKHIIVKAWKPDQDDKPVIIDTTTK